MPYELADVQARKERICHHTQVSVKVISLQCFLTHFEEAREYAPPFVDMIEPTSPIFRRPTCFVL